MARSKSNLSGQFDDWVWVDGEPVSREEIHQDAGFTERDPSYLLKKHKDNKEQKGK